MANDDQCDACGEHNALDAAFCVLCGTYLGWDQRAGDDAAQVRRPPLRDSPTSVTPEASPPTKVDSERLRSGPDPVPGEAGPATHRAETSLGGDAPCPSCGRPNAATRRFCGGCGYPLISAAASSGPPHTPRQDPERDRWWPPWHSSPERVARREYRQSLPPLYRWRRVLISVVGIVVVLISLTVFGQHPVSRAKQLWYELRDTTLPVSGVTAVEQPLDGQRVEITAITDADPTTVWARPWARGTAYEGCGGPAEADGFVVLILPEKVRVRALEVHAGLADPRSRDLEFKPAALDVTFRDAEGSMQCLHAKLDDTAEPQVVDVDTGVGVSRVRISISEAFTDKPAGEDSALVSLRKIVVRVRPDDLP